MSYAKTKGSKKQTSAQRIGRLERVSSMNYVKNANTEVSLLKLAENQKSIVEQLNNAHSKNIIQRLRTLLFGATPIKIQDSTSDIQAEDILKEDNE